LVFTPDALAGKGPSRGTSEVYALNAHTGKFLWKFSSDVALFDSLGELAIGGLYHRGIFYESLPHAREFAAIDAKNGHLLWKTPTHGAVKMSGVISSGLLFFADMSGYLYVVRASDGAVIQSIKFAGGFQSSAPVIVGKTLFIANGSAVYAVPIDDLIAGKLQAPAAS
jgi:outer membrane protein assembly factor BamB